MAHLQIMSNRQTLYQETLDVLTKYGAWFAYVLIGLVGTFGLDIINKKRITRLYILGTSFMGIFVGFITSKWFLAHAPEAGAYCVPVATLASRDIMIFLKLIDWRGVLAKVTRLEIKDKP